MLIHRKEEVLKIHGYYISRTGVPFILAGKIHGTGLFNNQNVFEKKLTLKRLGEVITSPKIIEVDRHLISDESVAPSIHVERDIEALIRLKEMFK